jgi:hypothetical protein
MAETLDFAEAENVAAIAMHFGTSATRESAYENYVTGAGGFPEFYQVAIQAGIALERVGQNLKITWGENADWIETVEVFAEAILKAMADGTFSHDALDAIATASIARF